ncbi:MAG: hypothetical protein JWN40_418 [Phycisphaerales bacterium]|nr:hypothetical protein [Phycisphaerales bacterium]
MSSADAAKSTAMEPTPELLAQLDREDIEQARRMRPEQRLLAGAELFDYACAITRAGIRAQHPGADEATVLRILRERLELASRFEDRV